MTINRENFATWTAALRSGEYKQGVGMLKQRGQEGEPLHCCLGVVCELVGLPSEPLESAPASPDFVFVDDEIREMGVLPPSAMAWLGVTENHGITFNPKESLPSLNDRGSTFEELADRIDAWVAGVVAGQS